MISTPTNVLLDQVAEWPLIFRWKFLESKISVNCLKIGNNPLKNIIEYRSIRLYNELDDECSLDTFIKKYRDSLPELNAPSNPPAFSYNYFLRFSEINVVLDLFDSIKDYKIKKGNYWYKNSKKLSAAGVL